MAVSQIISIIRRIDGGLFPTGSATDPSGTDMNAISLTPEEVQPDAPERAAGILDRSRATTQAGLCALRDRAARLDAEAARVAEDLRQTRRAIAALESAARIMGAGA